MAKFSLGGDDDSDEGGPSRHWHPKPTPTPTPTPKRMRIESTSQEPPSHTQPQWEQSEESESGFEGEETELLVGEESDYESEEEEDEQEDEDEQQQSSGDDVVISGSQPVENDVAEGSEDVDECQIMTLSDPDVLDCPICLEHLTIPVFQCDNGHIACSLCSTKVRNKCPSCALPIGYNRCRAIEKVIESVKISCRNSKYGCPEKTKYCNISQHKNTCTYAPCSCPQLNCTFFSSSTQLSAHFKEKHPALAVKFRFNDSFQILVNPNEKFFVLQENKGQLFILNNIEYQSMGNSISVNCIKPSTSKEVFSYSVVAKKDACVLKLNYIADNVAKRVENPNLKRYLMVPWDFVDSSGKIKLEVTILSQLPKTYPSRLTRMGLRL